MGEGREPHTRFNRFNIEKNIRVICEIRGQKSATNHHKFTRIFFVTIKDSLKLYFVSKIAECVDCVNFPLAYSRKNVIFVA